MGQAQEQGAPCGCVSWTWGTGHDARGLLSIIEQQLALGFVYSPKRRNIAQCDLHASAMWTSGQRCVGSGQYLP